MNSSGSNTHAAGTNVESCVVAHVNYLFFHSTQSFIYFFLSRFRRIHPICLTRTPESTVVRPELPPLIANDFYLYGQRASFETLNKLLWPTGLTLRYLLSRMSPRLAEPILDSLHRGLIPRLRPEANSRRFLEWAEGILLQRGVRLIHAYFGPVGWRMLALKRKLGLPLIVTFLGDEVATELDPWWWWWVQSASAEKPDWPLHLQELFEEADLCLVEGPFLRQKLVDLGAAPEKVQVQRIGIPVQQMPFDSRRTRPNGKTVIVFAGRFCEQKGLLYALEAVHQIWRTRRDIEFRLIGDETLTDGKYAARVRAYIRDHQLQDCVRLLGFLNHADYIREMQQADIFLHPSIVGKHGISEGGAPTTILEAQALGIPVVSTYHCDIPNVTVPGGSALLVPERDSKKLAQALRTLLDHPERWEPMGRAGRQHVEHFHEIEHEVAALEDKYLALLKNSFP